MAKDGLKKKKTKKKIIKRTTDKDGNKIKLELMKSKSLVPYTSIYEI